MSEWLIAAVSPKAVMRQLNRIDEACEAVPQSADVDIFQGPFRAFRSATSALSTSDDFPHSTGDVHSSQDTDRVEEDAFAFPNGTMIPRTTSIFHSLLDLPGEDLCSPTLPMWSTVDDTSRIQEIFDDAEIMINFPDLQSVPTLPDVGHEFPFSASAYDPRPKQVSPPRSLSVSRVEVYVPHDAVHLIKRYSTAVLTLLTPFQYSKIPWDVLFVPHVKSKSIMRHIVKGAVKPAL